MKRTLITLSLSLLTSNFLLAQEEEVVSSSKFQKVRFGAYVAPNISWMKPANSKSNDGAYNVSNNGSKIGFTWGLLMDYWFADNYALTTGLQINGTGGKILANAVSQNASKVYTADFDYSFQYLEIPVNIKLKTSPIGSTGMNFFGQAGLTAGFNISKRVTYNVIETDENNNALPAVSEDKVKLKGLLSVAPIIFQLNVGAGVQYPFSERLAGYAGIFFNNGFAPDVTNPAKYDLNYQHDFSDGNIRLNNIALRFGLFF